MTPQEFASMGAALKAIGANPPRIALGTDQAVALLQGADASLLVAPPTLPAVLANAKAALDAPAATDFEAELARVTAVRQAADALWDVLEGATLDGVEIIRRR